MKANPFYFAVLLMAVVVTIAGCKAGAPIKFAATPFTSPRVTHQQPVNSVPRFDAQTIVTLESGDSLDALLRESSAPVLVDFYADWCGPCRQQGQVLFEFAADTAQRRPMIVKVNIDQHPELAKRYQVSSLPTLVVLENGQVLQRHAGLVDRESVEELLGL